MVFLANGRAAYFSYSVGKGLPILSFLLYSDMLKEALDWISPP